MTDDELLNLFRCDPLCAALSGIPDNVVMDTIASIPKFHPEITIANYGSMYDEAIVMAAAHRIAYGEMFRLASQVAIAKGQPFYKHDGDPLETTPYGQRLMVLRCQSTNVGAFSIQSEGCDRAEFLDGSRCIDGRWLF